MVLETRIKAQVENRAVPKKESVPKKYVNSNNRGVL